MSVINLGGRPRKPTALKELEGTVRPDRANAREPKTRLVRIPPPPEHLSSCERQAWKRLAKVVDPMKIATASDLESFAFAVQTIAAAHLAAREVFESGSVTDVEETAHGGAHAKVKPALTAMVQLQKLWIVHANRWGLTPGDRSRVSTLEGDDKDSKDPLAEFES